MYIYIYIYMYTYIYMYIYVYKYMYICITLSPEIWDPEPGVRLIRLDRDRARAGRHQQRLLLQPPQLSDGALPVSGNTIPCRMTGYNNPVKDDRSDFTRGCIPRLSVFEISHPGPGPSTRWPPLTTAAAPTPSTLKRCAPQVSSKCLTLQPEI